MYRKASINVGQLFFINAKINKPSIEITINNGANHLSVAAVQTGFEV